MALRNMMSFPRKRESRIGPGSPLSRGYQSFVAAQPYTTLTDEAIYKTGKIFFLQHNYDAAVNAFEQLFNKSPDASYKAKASLMEGYVFYENENAGRSLATLNRVELDHLPAKLQIQCLSLKILAAEKNGQPELEMIYSALRLADLYHENTNPALGQIEGADLLSQGETVHRISNWISSPMALADIPSWFKNYPAGYARSFIDYKWGKTYYEAGQMDAAERKL